MTNAPNDPPPVNVAPSRSEAPGVSGDREAKLEEALRQIAALNDLSGAKDDEVEAAARNALYACEVIARAALTRSEADEAPGVEIPAGMVREAFELPDRNCAFCGSGWTSAHKHRCPRAMEDYE